MAPPHAGGNGVCADEFVIMLRHLGEASGSLLRAKGGRHAMRAAKELDFFGAGGVRLLLARLECIAQGLQDMLSAISVLICLLVLKIALRLVLINNALPCRRCCSWGRGKTGVHVDKLTAVHWALTNMVVQLQGLRQERASRHRAVRDFLSRYKISSLLSLRVRRHVDRSLPQLTRDHNADSVRRLATQLLMDLLEEMRIPAFSTHPFFVNLRQKHPHLVRELCQEALHLVLKTPDERVFCAGEVCSRMYVIVNGHVQYLANIHQRADAPAGAGPAQVTVRRILHSGQWLSEAALWTGWVHRGELRAVTDSLLFALDAAGFARVISSHKSAHAFAASYARKFVESLNRVLQTDLVEAGPVDQ